MAKKKIKTDIKVDGHSITRVKQKPSLPKATIEKYKRDRQNLYSQKSYWVNKWNTATKKKEANRAFARAQDIQRELNRVNQKLGVTYELPAPKKGVRFEQGQRKTQYNIWEGIKQIRSIIKKKFYKTFIIDGKKISAKYPSRVFEAYDDISRLAYAIPRGTPLVEFTSDSDTKEVLIEIY